VLHFEDAAEKASTRRQPVDKPLNYGIGALGKLLQFYIHHQPNTKSHFFHSEFDGVTYLDIPQQFAIPQEEGRTLSLSNRMVICLILVTSLFSSFVKCFATDSSKQLVQIHGQLLSLILLH
jgi:hypothetical protein